LFGYGLVEYDGEVVLVVGVSFICDLYVWCYEMVWLVFEEGVFVFCGIDVGGLLLYGFVVLEVIELYCVGLFCFDVFVVVIWLVCEWLVYLGLVEGGFVDLVVYFSDF